ncbi:MAG: ABC transporter ATP-binding protein [Chthoniobacterales bacterium]|nr:ABC transporter ATP-binding protein [Chthoniobacterales bacterium]
MNSPNDILSVEDLRTYFHTRAGIARAVDGVSFSLGRGETLGIVGESGSGKSVACYSLLRLIPQPPGRIESGRASFGGLDLLHCREEELRKIRGRRVAMIFQDPMSSLNPYLRIGDQVMEPLLIHGLATPNEAFELGVEALREVGIQDAARRMASFPHEFSGGMRQRVMIAMALITKPEVLLADEPTTALDVTVQAQILELIRRLQKERGTAVIFVTHDIGVVSGFCDRVLVMYAGRVLESGPTAALFYQPKHPYNQALQRSIPALHERGAELHTIPGAPPDVTQPVRGCPFAPRCEFAEEKCVTSEIALQEVSAGHATACLRVQLGEIDLAPAAFPRE